jgi:methionyl-tRNA synthetase
LANGLGNLVARVAKLADKWKISIDKHIDIDWSGDWTKPITDFRVDIVLQNIWEQIKAVDKHINENAPWKIVDKPKAVEVLTWEAEQVLEIGKKLAPFMPSTNQKIIAQFSSQPIKPADNLFPRL